MFEKVLFPIDFSEYAHKTLECIREIPGIKEVVLLHVIDYLTFFGCLFTVIVL